MASKSSTKKVCDEIVKRIDAFEFSEPDLFPVNNARFVATFLLTSWDWGSRARTEVHVTGRIRRTGDVARQAVRKTVQVGIGIVRPIANTPDGETDISMFDLCLKYYEDLYMWLIEPEGYTDVDGVWWERDKQVAETEDQASYDEEFLDQNIFSTTTTLRFISKIKRK